MPVISAYWYAEAGGSLEFKANLVYKGSLQRQPRLHRETPLWKEKFCLIYKVFAMLPTKSSGNK